VALPTDPVDPQDRKARIIQPAIWASSCCSVRAAKAHDTNCSRRPPRLLDDRFLQPTYRRVDTPASIRSSITRES
jgi:hypothetical protein